ncbi:hypothetical protein TWF481_005547 [Arthrobotrys musiformis]|uniref:DUF7770 domain-containing protein n=1 Tax=Arthrobotrys musiformis TaxID=47236 RepID=A0AAV9WE82_9PEZI
MSTSRPRALTIAVPTRSRVVDVRVVVHKTRGVVNNRPVNHWCLYLHTEEGYVVKVNMREKTSEEWSHIPYRDADYGRPGILDISAYETHSVTPSMIKAWDLHTVGRPRVKDLISVLRENHREFYTMSKCGSGCRFWVYTAISDFEGAGYVNVGTMTFIHERLMFWYDLRPDLTVAREPVDTMPPGKFWTPEAWNAEWRRYDTFHPSSDLWHDDFRYRS